MFAVVVFGVAACGLSFVVSAIPGPVLQVGHESHSGCSQLLKQILY